MDSFNPSFPSNPLHTSFHNRNGGKKVYSIEKSGLSIAPGNQIQVPFILDLHPYDAYHVHYFVNATLDVDVYWKPTISDNFALEKTVPVTPTVGGIGGILSGSTRSRFLKIDFISTDIVPVTDISVFVYGVG
jgi:hypothetical protein